MGKRLRVKKGIARGKENSILSGHYVFFKQLVDDIILFISITHSEVVTIMDKVINTIALKNNINPNEKNKKSFIVPSVYKGKREDIGAYNKNLRISNSDEDTVNDLITSLTPIDYATANKEYKQYQKTKKK